MQYRDECTNEYAALFTDGGGAASKLAEKWGWYHVLVQLANEQILQIEEITERPIESVFMHLCYLKDLAQERKQDNK